MTVDPTIAAAGINFLLDPKNQELVMAAGDKIDSTLDRLYAGQMAAGFKMDPSTTELGSAEKPTNQMIDAAAAGKEVHPHVHTTDHSAAPGIQTPGQANVARRQEHKEPGKMADAKQAAANAVVGPLTAALATERNAMQQQSTQGNDQAKTHAPNNRGGGIGR